MGSGGLCEDGCDGFLWVSARRGGGAEGLRLPSGRASPLGPLPWGRWGRDGASREAGVARPWPPEAHAVPRRSAHAGAALGGEGCVTWRHEEDYLKETHCYEPEQRHLAAGGGAAGLLQA